MKVKRYLWRQITSWHYVLANARAAAKLTIAFSKGYDFRQPKNPSQLSKMSEAEPWVSENDEIHKESVNNDKSSNAADIATVVLSWRKLPDAIRAAIMTMVRMAMPEADSQ
jgi:hypothetical protein